MPGTASEQYFQWWLRYKK